MNLNCTCQIWCYPRYRVKLTVCKGRETSVEVWKCASVEVGLYLLNFIKKLIFLIFC
jgi:hypothetical protein